MKRLYLSAIYVLPVFVVCRTAVLLYSTLAAHKFREHGNEMEQGRGVLRGFNFGLFWAVPTWAGARFVMRSSFGGSFDYQKSAYVASD